MREMKDNIGVSGINLEHSRGYNLSELNLYSASRPVENEEFKSELISKTGGQK